MTVADEIVRKNVALAELETKCPNSECGCDGKGFLKATFATLGVVDKDGDVVHKGAIGKQDVLISAYQHKSWDGALPVGKGRVYEKGDLAIFEGHFNMELQSGHDHYTALKFAPELAQFSWGFNTTKHDYEKTDDGWLIMNIRETKIFEVSPVLVGAGVGTGVMEMKSRHGRSEDTSPLIEETLLYHPEVVKARLEWERMKALTLKEV